MTLKYRPELLEKRRISEEDQRLLKEIEEDRYAEIHKDSRKVDG